MGVTVIVAVTGSAPVLIAVKAPILPVPEAARPIVALLLVQLNTVPAVGLVNVIAVVLEPLHTVWLATAPTVGIGFTVIVKLLGVPGQLLAVGVTVMVATTGAVPGFWAVKLAILPVPLAARPMDGWLLVQL